MNVEHANNFQAPTHAKWQYGLGSDTHVMKRKGTSKSTEV